MRYGRQFALVEALRRFLGLGPLYATTNGNGARKGWRARRRRQPS